MKGLWHTIAPFATDVSGACAVFQHAQALVIAQDSNGAVSNLRRVIDIKEATADFETLDLPENAYTLGREEDFQARMRELFELDARDVDVVDPRTRSRVHARGHEPYELAVLANGPVPNLLGTDLDMRARLFEESCGLPVLAVPTTGNKYYDHGIAAAYQAIYERFVLPGTDGLTDGVSCDTCSVNILGATELDWPGVQLYARLIEGLEEGGEHIASDFGYQDSVASWQQSAHASRNIVATASGLALARAMERDLGIPYTLLDELDVFDGWVEGIALVGAPRVLVIGEAITSRLVRRLLMKAGAAKVDIATFFMFDRSLRDKGDVRLSGEADLYELFKRGAYDCVIGDAVFENLCPLPYRALMHPPVGYGARDGSELAPTWFKSLAHWWNGIYTTAEDALDAPASEQARGVSPLQRLVDASAPKKIPQASTARRRLSELDL